jgi:hypothetical protein
VEENVHNSRERREEERDKVGKYGVRMRSDEKTKQKRRDRFTFNVQHKFEARTLIGAPRKTLDGPIRSFDETRVRHIPNGHRSDLPLFGEGVGVGCNQVVGNGLGG